MDAQHVAVAPPRFEEVVARLRAGLPEIVTSYPIMLAYLHGSVAEGRATPSSDVDVALIFEPNCGLTGYQRLMIELEIAAQVEDHCQIREADVRSIDSAPLKVQGRVITTGTLVYSRDDTFRISYEVRTRDRYFDYLPTARLLQKEYYKRIAKEAPSHDHYSARL
jgi:predicted nucleotidyltransferase